MVSKTPSSDRRFSRVERRGWFLGTLLAGIGLWLVTVGTIALASPERYLDEVAVGILPGASVIERGFAGVLGGSFCLAVAATIFRTVVRSPVDRSLVELPGDRPRE